MRRMLITAAAGLALTLTATAPSLAADQLVDTCREVPEADAAKLKNRPAVLADIDGTLSQMSCSTTDRPTPHFSTWASPIPARMPR